MLLFATWQSKERERKEEWRFRTPLGPGFVSLREELGHGQLVTDVDVGTTSRYIEPGKYSALGGLAFWDVPEIRGTATKLRLTAVPHEWIAAADTVVSILARAGLRARIVERQWRRRDLHLRRCRPEFPVSGRQ